MSLRHALLGVLAHEPRSGYALLKHFEQSLAYAWPASHSQIYPELARLLEQGLIEQTGSGARGAKTYATTAAGIEEVRRWLRTEPDRRVRSDAAVRVFFLWLLEPAEAAAFLRAERDRYLALHAELERIQAEEEPANPKQRAYRVALVGGLLTFEARIRWAEWALEEVSSWR
ncbi:MAG TPA: PadR family transcriptional regulator [Gaiellaceae bacterium]|nr:PadR family transcriptional regulator [Gaiellaceae bacterium]